MYITIDICKQQNAQLYGYEGRKSKKSGGKTQLSKARVVNDRELLALVDAGEERVTRTQAAKAKKLMKEELARELAAKYKCNNIGNVK